MNAFYKNQNLQIDLDHGELVNQEYLRQNESLLSQIRFNAETHKTEVDKANLKRKFNQI